MAYIEPELRENMGEVEAAMEERLPELISYDELEGDLQVHTTWSDGSANIEDMTKAAYKLGYEYIGITDHSGSLRIADGMDEKQIRKQMEEINRLNEKMEEITILKGVEVNIKSNGKLDLEDQLLKDLDLVVAAIHHGFREEKETMTWRITSAMENPYIDIIAHPTGRKIQERKAYDLDFERIYEVARKTDTYLEVNAQPNRLDLSDINIKRALGAECKLVINTDAHKLEQLKYIDLGIATARCGWSRKIDIINTLPLKKLNKLLI